MARGRCRRGRGRPRRPRPSPPSVSRAFVARPSSGHGKRSTRPRSSSRRTTWESRAAWRWSAGRARSSAGCAPGASESMASTKYSKWRQPGVARAAGRPARRAAARPPRRAAARRRARPRRASRVSMRTSLAVLVDGTTKSRVQYYLKQQPNPSQEHLMAHLSIIGTGNMGQAIAAVAGKGGHTVQLLGQDDADTAGHRRHRRPRGPLPRRRRRHRRSAATSLAGKIVVDITNPLELRDLRLPRPSRPTAPPPPRSPPPCRSRACSRPSTPPSPPPSPPAPSAPLPTTVLIAGDDADAKSTLAGVVTSGGLKAIDAGVAAAGPRARGARLPAAHPRRGREGLLDRRLRRRRLTARHPTTTTRERSPAMTVNAVRLNHAVLFVADLERSVALLPAGLRHDGHGARAPRQRRVPAPAPLGQPPRPRPLRGRRPAAPAAAARSGSTTWPGRSTPSRSSRRPG